MPRPTPFDLVFADIAAERFPAIQAELEVGAADARDRDAFLLSREAVALVRDLRPDEGVGEGIGELVALLHHAFLFWRAGTMTLELARPAAERLLGDGSGAPPADAPAPPAFYLQLPPRLVWAQLVPGDPHEPLDGCFITDAGDQLRVLGIFGVQPGGNGFSVAEAGGTRPGALARPDRSPLFSPVLPGGAAARLWSVTGAEELLELGWRGHDAARHASVTPGSGAGPVR